ncbi:MAG TPA: hypothetical protein VMU01_07840 [Rhizomicrobium sp.]|nr:hypothetical protein [Rhizomicrobium sp.]
MKGIVIAVFLLAAPAFATDTSSLSAFLNSCQYDTKVCRDFARTIVLTARSQNYGCIPPSLSADDAAQALFLWMRGPASADPRFLKTSLEDTLWSGIDELWPCAPPAN